MVDSSVIIKRIGKIRKCVMALQKIHLEHTKEEFLNDDVLKAAVERNVQVAIQSVLDICNHVVADMKLEVPDEEKQAFSIMAAHQLISFELAAKLGLMAGMRNVLVHEYLEIDYDRLYEVMTHNIADFEELIAAILQFM